jgi:hypothetical protein
MKLVDGVWVASFFMEILFTTLKVALKKKSLSCLLQEDWSSCVYDSNVWQLDDDMVTDLFRPFKDDLSQHTQGDLQSSFGSCDAYPFGDTYFFYENFQPPSPPDLDRYQYMAIP